MQKALVWFKNDLRIHDNEPLITAVNNTSNVLGVYCFDPRDYALLPIGFNKTGSIRASFIIESVQQLKQKLQSLGSDLLVYIGLPEDIIPSLCISLNAKEVYCHKEIAANERDLLERLDEILFKQNVTLKSYWGNTLFHPEDLPMPIKRLPELFTDFRKSVERETRVRACFPSPKKINPITPVPHTKVPSLNELGLTDFEIDKRKVLSFVGGEDQALARLDEYIWLSNSLKNYKNTRNEMLGANNSSKFSAWLAIGCISASKIYHEITRYENTRIKNESTYWLFFELLWRDYFRFIMLKHGSCIFDDGGIQKLAVKWNNNASFFELWRTGRTGFPLVDANMQELLLTGYMSNRGRQNVASFLTKNLGLNWLLGAQWFESQLIDYDVHSNYGNWNYAAGVGNDARGFRYFNIIKQATQYDSNGDYVRHWLPGLAKLPGNISHQPYALKPGVASKYNFELTKDYWNPIVDLDTSVKANELIFNKALGIK